MDDSTMQFIYNVRDAAALVLTTLIVVASWRIERIKCQLVTLEKASTALDSISETFDEK